MEEPPNILATSFVVLLILFGGCAGLVDEDHQQRNTETQTVTTEAESPKTTSKMAEGKTENRIIVENFDNQPRNIAILLTSKGEVVEFKIKEIQPGKQWDVSTINSAGNYTIIAEMPGGNRVEREYSLPLAGADRKSYTNIHIQEDGGMVLEIFSQL